MGQDYPDVDTGSGGDDYKTAVDNLLTRTDTLRQAFSGTSAPSSPEVGQLWIDTSATPYRVYIYADIGAGDAWVLLGPVQRLNGDICLDSSSTDTRAAVNQLKGARLENRSAHVSPAAGNIGFIYFHTTDGCVYVLDQGVTNSRLGLLSIQDGTSYDSVDIDLAGSNHNDGTNPPTRATKGTTPTVCGWLFDATNEKMVVRAKVPHNWDGASDLRFRLTCVLNQAETNGDDIEWSGNLVSVTPGTDAVSKTSTATAASATDIGSGSGDGVEHECDIVVDFDHADNPVAAGDTIYLEINRTEVTNVGGVILTAVRLLYKQKARHARAA